MSEIIHAIVDERGAVVQTIVWDGVTPWPAPQDAKAMEERGIFVVKAPTNQAITLDHVYDRKTKTFDWSAEAKVAQAEAVLAAAESLDAMMAEAPVKSGK